MPNELRFDGKVAIVTGAGQGLGRSHALLLASRGAKVLVNDLGGAATGEGKSSAAADHVVAEIKERGGEAAPSYDSVEAGDKIVQAALDHFGRVDIVINNAGILRDKSFAKMTEEDWELITRVHINGAFKVTHAAWPHLRDQQYGRVIMTASAAGIYGNFGQANYAMAKLGLVGFGQTLALEGQTKNVLVNIIAPIAGSRLTETVLPKELVDALRPEYVSPLVAYLCHESCESNGGLFEVGGGYFAKLRWERTKGEMFRLGRNITPEDVARSWEKITSFEGSTRPATVAESMSPILDNVRAGPSKGGNALIDVDLALGYEFPEMQTRYDERDVALYALGIGAAQDPTDERDLQLVYEMHQEGLKTLPTFGVIPAINTMVKMAKEGKTAPGFNYTLDRLLHGEQYTEITRPLPTKATLTHKSKVVDIFDKGKNALIITETKSYDEAGELLIINRFSAVIRGAGGWGGDRGPGEEENTPPTRAPDATITEKSSPNQALLYRLSGDWNPLHADPGMARAFGFERPILHGLCTYGYAVRHVVNAFCKGDPRYFKSAKVRFADPVVPGETLVTEMWKESETRIVFQVKVKERDAVVISRAAVELYQEIPKPKPKPKAEAPATAAAPASAEPISTDIFTAIGQYIGEHPEIVGSIKTVYQFKLSSPDSTWTIDLKNGAGGVAAGESQPADCTLAMTDADFMDMCTGKADAQKLFMSGKLKIAGNIMASQKLEFLRKLPPESVMAAAKKRAGSAPAGEAAPASGPNSGDVFIGIRDYVSKNADLVSKIGTIYQFRLTEPDSVWTIDLKNAPGAVVAGSEPKADCTLQLTDADFMAMTSGAADPQKLFMTGKLKISGNIMASQKLEFLKKIDKEEAARAVMEAKKAGAPKASAAAAAPTSKSLKSPEVFAKLRARIEKTPGLVGEVQAVVVFKIESTDRAWTVDLKNGKGSLAEGAKDNVDAVMTLDDDAMVEIVRDPSNARDLFQRGRLRVDGNVDVAHRLGFLKDLI